MTLSGFEGYLIDCELGTSTIRSYLLAVKAFTNEDKPFESTPVHDFLRQKLLTLSHAGVNLYIKAFKHYCGFLGLSVFPCITKKKETPKSRILLTDKEIEEVIACEDSKYTLFWTLLAYTGARPGEICALKPEDIDLSNKIIYIQKSKTGLTRKAPIADHIIDPLTLRLRTLSSPYLFALQRTGKPITYMSYMVNWKKRLEILGITKKVAPYSFRHSFITNSLGNGADLFAVQDIVGHTSAQTTRMYYHGNINLMKKALHKLPLVVARQNPEELIETMNSLIDEFLGKNDFFDKIEILEAKKHLLMSVKTHSDMV
jgi:integrase